MVEQEIMPVDKAYRIKMFIIFFVLIGAVAAARIWGLPALQGYWQSLYDAGENTRLLHSFRISEFIMALVMLGLLPFGIYNVRAGLRVRREQRYPATGMRVLRNTPVVTGEAAVKRGGIIVFAGTAISIVSVIMCIMVILVVEVLIHGGHS